MFKKIYKSAVEPVYYILDPSKEWSSLKERHEQEALDRALVAEIFDDRAEFDGYREEFLNSSVPQYCFSGEEEISDQYTVYDIHKKECVRYYAIARKTQPSVVVESGTYSGVSTLALLEALRQNGSGTLYSVDYTDAINDAELEWGSSDHFHRAEPSCCEAGSELLPPDKEPGWIIPKEYEPFWDFKCATSRSDLFDRITDVSPVDLYLHDSTHSHPEMLSELSFAWSSLSEAGILLSHHTAWNEAWETLLRDTQTPGSDLTKRLDDDGIRTASYLRKLPTQ